MDPQFAFPPPATPQRRPPPVRRQEDLNGGARESNALRASVLDAALELGLIGGGVGGWMSENRVEEGEVRFPPAICFFLCMLFRLWDSCMEAPRRGEVVQSSTSLPPSTFSG